ncbi:MAG: ABC transporter substrate-binding protein [Candidatus Magasanikbacteria bacterium]|jgi:branched-chain amino acid transport system substrate-binding protein|nr:ABC transporter substrate-binding protein [Candidatus Magasanikbacteria bacterium]MBT4221141.1 ABC transporter substrate-binding protein [Candidatus Magasanikbacteria bacterium]MBT4350289.1 ABC transporter substrate-binding protein [Candidatus Magasanikbacteria bacterium]MBT4541715.1 ABC transporter substrate-binding protein [Candidatus Magasanikbacteria bacterium]MBT6253308.1 ABC transporter substrate-binding protein [Candidatus Magasanikbacteria bacterium]
MAKKQISLFLGAFACLALIGGGCAVVEETPDDIISTDGEEVTEEAPIRIGWMGPLSGDLSSLGEDALAAAELAVEEVNEAGGIDGRLLELVAEDSRCNAKDATAAANKLINIEGVKLINGAACSPETTAVAPIAEQNKVIVLSYCSSAPPITDAGDYIFRSYPSDAFQGVFAANYIYNDLGKRKVAIMNTQDDWGIGLSGAFKNRFEELGGEITSKDEFTPDRKDFRSELTKIKASDAELVYFPGFTEASIAALKQVTELGIEKPFFGGDTWADTTIHESGLAEGITFVVPKTSLSDDFVSKMEARGANPTVCSPRAYDNIKLFASIIEDVGTDTEKIKEALYNTRNFEGVAGPISFDENGDLTIAEYDVFRIEDGEQVMLTK